MSETSPEYIREQLEADTKLAAKADEESAAIESGLFHALMALVAAAPPPDRLDYEYRDALHGAQRALARAKGES